MQNASCKSQIGVPSGHVPGLDGIRALAVGLVLFSHSVIYDSFSNLRPIGLSAGCAGVAVFFVLSGYLITTLLLREEDRTGNISLRLFYLRRALRLFPALWLYLLVVGVIWISGGLPHHPWHSFVSSIFYVRNLVGRGHETDHLWSLSIEEQFYLLWPLVLVALPRRDKTRLIIGLTVLISVTVWRVMAARAGLASVGALYLRSDFRLDAPLFGCVLALALRVAPRTVTRWNSTAFRSGMLGLTGIAGLAGWIGMGLSQFVYPGTDATIVCLLGLMLVLSQIGATGSVWLAWRPLVAIGQVSYGIYLWQQLFLGPANSELGRIRAFPIGLAATLTMAAASYWFLEKPLLRWKDRRFHKQSRESGSLANTPALPAPSRTAA
jgi:peptidoglycan/LPS O-acetylase OafA/YrhL